MKSNKPEYWDDEIEEFQGKAEILSQDPKNEKIVNVNLDLSTGLPKSEEAKWNRFFMIIAAIWMVLFTIGLPAWFIYMIFFM